MLGWDRILARLREVHAARPDSLASFEALVERLQRDGVVAPRVSVGWLLFTQPGRSGSVTVCLGQRPGHYTVSEGSHFVEANLDTVVSELNRALKALATDSHGPSQEHAFSRWYKR